MAKMMPLIFKLCLFLPGLALAATPLQSFEPDSMARIIEQHKGKPFMMLVWSLDCGFCQVSLKTLSKLKHEGKPLNIVTVSTDPVDDPQAAALMQQRLSDLKLRQEAWAFGDASPEKLKYAIDPKWHGEKPRSYWFNPRGERVAYSGLLDEATIRKLHAQVSK